jgi:hypothetical protein
MRRRDERWRIKDTKQRLSTHEGVPSMNTAPNDDGQPAAGYHAARLSRRSSQDPFLDQVISLLPALRAFGCSLCGDASRADDLAQDTMIKAHLKREQFQASTNLKAWLFTILRNQAARRSGCGQGADRHQ